MEADLDPISAFMRHLTIEVFAPYPAKRGEPAAVVKPQNDKALNFPLLSGSVIICVQVKPIAENTYHRTQSGFFVSDRLWPRCNRLKRVSIVDRFYRNYRNSIRHGLRPTPRRSIVDSRVHSKWPESYRKEIYGRPMQRVDTISDDGQGQSVFCLPSLHLHELFSGAMSAKRYVNINRVHFYNQGPAVSSDLVTLFKTVSFTSNVSIFTIFSGS
jgi:hypothetical protein